MIKFYDKRDGSYFEFIDVGSEYLESLKNNENIVSITDGSLLSAVESISQDLRRFITILSNNVSVDQTKLKADLINYFKILRKDIFEYLDGEYFKLQEKILFEIDNDKKQEFLAELKIVVENKEAWRNIDSNINSRDFSSAKSYKEIVENIRKDLDPLYQEINHANTVQL